MPANQLLNMVVRLLLRRVLRGGVNRDVTAATRRRPKATGSTPQQARQQAETTQRAKQTMRALRRFGRF